MNWPAVGGQTAQIADSIVASTPSRWRSASGALLKRPQSAVAFGLLLLIVVVAILAPLLAPYDPDKPFYDAILAAPSAHHLLGTDSIGRDLLSRLIWGSRTTIEVGLLAVAIGLGIGTTLGVIAGFIGRQVDNVIMRIMDIMLAIPGILLAMAIVAILGPSLGNAMIAVGISSVPTFTRLVRGATLAAKSREYVQAGYSFGSSRTKIIVQHIVPNISSVLIVFSTLSMGVAILDTAGLSFIGLGAQPPTPEWGSMLSDGKDYLTQAWWLATFPGMAITLVVLCVNLLGDGLRDVLDPQTQPRQ